MPTDLPCRWGQRLFSFFEMARLILYAFSLETHCFLKINSVNDLITTWSGPDLLKSFLIFLELIHHLI